MIDKLEAVMAQKAAETARLRRVEVAASAALEELDAMIGPARDDRNEPSRAGTAG